MSAPERTRVQIITEIAGMRAVWAGHVKRALDLVQQAQNPKVEEGGPPITVEFLRKLTEEAEVTISLAVVAAIAIIDLWKELHGVTAGAKPDHLSQFCLEQSARWVAIHNETAKDHDSIVGVKQALTPPPDTGGPGA